MAFIICLAFGHVLFVLVGVKHCPLLEGRTLSLVYDNIWFAGWTLDATLCVTPLQPLILCVFLSGRRTLASTTHGVVLAQETSARGNYGLTWVTSATAKSESMAFCPIHTSRLWWVLSVRTRMHLHFFVVFMLQAINMKRVTVVMESISSHLDQ